MFMLCKCYKFYERLHRIRHNAKNPERQKTSFPKEPVKNADFHKPVLNKIMTTHE